MGTRLPRCHWVLLGLALVLAAGAACAPAARPAAPAGPATGAGERASGAGAATAGGERAPAVTAAAVEPFTAAKTMPLEELHQRALAEGGTFHFYATLAPAA